MRGFSLFISVLASPALLACLLISGLALAQSLNSSKSESAAMLDRVLADPHKYLDGEITVEGILQTATQGLNRRFFLQNEEGKLLEVQPWAPLEIYHPPHSQVGGTRPKPMGYFVGRHLRLTGRLQKDKEAYILKVSAAEEL